MTQPRGLNRHDIDTSGLEHLRAIRGELGEIKGDLRDIKLRMTSLERQVAALHVAVGHLHGDFAGQSVST